MWFGCGLGGVGWGVVGEWGGIFEKIKEKLVDLILSYVQSKIKHFE